MKRPFYKIYNGISLALAAVSACIGDGDWMQAPRPILNIRSGPCK